MDGLMEVEDIFASMFYSLPWMAATAIVVYGACKGL